jgi:alpha-L-fucosidase
VRAAGLNATFLLNVGPQPNGKLQAEQVERLREMGAWLKLNGESVYGTRGGPISPRPWGVTTRKDKTVYVHVFDWADPQLVIPSPGAVKQARALRGGASVKLQETAGGLLIELPPRDPYDTVIALELK